MATGLTPAARARLMRQQQGTQAEQWQDFWEGIPEPVRSFTARIGQRPAIPTQEEIDAQNAARQARRTLKEGQGGQTAAGIRRMQSGQPENAQPLETAMEERWRKMTAPGASVLRPAAAIPAVPAPGRSLAGTGPSSNMPFPIPPEVAERGQRNVQLAGLMDEGFGLLGQQPGARDAISGGLNLGPNNILVREGSVGPEVYQAAMDARGDAIQRGQDAGFERSHGYGGYLPNLPTQQALQEGGPITEYVVPGKGTATFLGQRKGGGTLSVIGGRTPEEQKLIDQQVASIESQRRALRALRNAEREAEGLAPLPTQQQLADEDLIDRIMGAFGDNPTLASNVIQQAFSSRAARASAEQAALQAQRENEMNYYQGLNELAQWQAEHDLNVQKYNVDAEDKGRRWTLDALQSVPVMDDDAIVGILKNFTKEDVKGNLDLDEPLFQKQFGIKPFTKDTKPRVGADYFSEEDGYMVATPDGLVVIGDIDDYLRYRHMQAQQQRMRALGRNQAQQ